MNKFKSTSNNKLGPLQPPQIQLTCPDGSLSELDDDQMPWQRRRSARVSAAAPPPLASCVEPGHELTVCDIIGDWGLYQWSLCMFAAIYSAVSAFVVMFGPLLTPDMAHICKIELVAPSSNATNSTGASSVSDNSYASQATLIPTDRHECFVGANVPAAVAGEELILDDAQQPIAVKCTSFLYNDLGHGLMLTNGFDLVCDRQWLKSLVFSSALVGMLVSSVTLGLFSDKFGRLRCVQVGFVISCLGNAVCLVAGDYFLFCACICLVSFAQIGVANALCTLVMEATSPRFRYVPLLQYGVGWGLGAMLLPLVNDLTLDYRLLMGVLLLWQLVMIPWLHYGVFESIRWLLSEGHFNKAQIELRRACRINNIQTDAKLAKSIARIEAQQVRKASRVIEHELAPIRLSQALGARVDETTRELDMLSAAIRKSLFGEPDDELVVGYDEEGTNDIGEQHRDAISVRSMGSRKSSNSSNIQRTYANEQQLPTSIEALSPTLTRMSFSLEGSQHANGRNSIAPNGSANQPGAVSTHSHKNSISFAVEPERKSSLTTQGLIQLAMKYSKTVQREDQGQCFVVQMFHRKLWRSSLVLLLCSIMFETAYFGLVQANSIVGASVNWNYFTGALSDLAAAIISCFMLAFLSRKCSLISCSMIASLICIAMALSYQLVPDLSSFEQQQLTSAATNDQSYLKTTAKLTETRASADNRADEGANLNPTSMATLLDQAEEFVRATSDVVNSTSGLDAILDQLTGIDPSQRANLVELRHSFNFYLMFAGKFVLSTGCQIAATVAMEAYPNNLRQTGPGVIVLAGRLGSILVPFLMNDSSEDKTMFKLTLVVLGAIGLLVCCMIPCTIRDQKDKELCDQLDEIE